MTLGQLILDLPHRTAHGAEDFLVSGCSDRRFARTPSALVAADAKNSHAEDFPALGIHQHFHEALRLAALSRATDTNDTARLVLEPVFRIVVAAASATNPYKLAAPEAANGRNIVMALLYTKHLTTEPRATRHAFV